MPKATREENVLYPNLLKNRRTFLGMTVPEMATKIGVAVASIYRWESGTHYPRVRAIRHRVFRAYQSTPEIAYPTCWEALFRDTGKDQMGAEE